MCGVDAGGLEYGGRIGCKKPRGVAVRAAFAAAADPAVVIADDTEMMRQGLGGGPPPGHACCLAGNQEQGLPLAVFGPRQLGTVRGKGNLHLHTVPSGVPSPLWCSARWGLRCEAGLRPLTIFVSGRGAGTDAA